jgi:hypothetical protein
MTSREHALSVIRYVALESNSTSMAASSARVIMWMGGVEWYKILNWIPSAGYATLVST